jgi:adenine-specific DNA-methyltransferase
LTCFHSIYLKQEFLTKLELMMAYLLTPFSHSIILCNRREYGNGLIKFEPNDLNSALIIDIAEIDSKIENAVLELYYDYRNSVLVDQPDSGVVQTLNELFSSWVA